MAPPCQVEHGNGAGARAGARGCTRWTRGSRASGLVAALPFIGHRCFAGDEAERRRSQGHGAAALLNGRERTEGCLSTRSSPETLLGSLLGRRASAGDAIGGGGAPDLQGNRRWAAAFRELRLDSAQREKEGSEAEGLEASARRGAAGAG
jgi:hypothetical protein